GRAGDGVGQVDALLPAVLAQPVEQPPRRDRDVEPVRGRTREPHRPQRDDVERGATPDAERAAADLEPDSTPSVQRHQAVEMRDEPGPLLAVREGELGHRGAPPDRGGASSASSRYFESQSRSARVSRLGRSWAKSYGTSTDDARAYTVSSSCTSY